MPNQKWLRFMQVLSIFGIILGLILAFTNIVSPISGIYYDYYLGEGTYATLSQAELQYQRLLYGIMGALMASWFTVFAYLVNIPFRRGEKWAWNALLLSTLIWFAGDSYVSIATGFAVHAVLNLSLLVPIAIALMATRSDMTS